MALLHNYVVERLNRVILFAVEQFETIQSGLLGFTHTTTFAKSDEFNKNIGGKTYNDCLPMTNSTA